MSWSRSYSQRYSYDEFFNMSRKVSSERRSPGTGIPGRFDYDLGYVYDVEKPHQARRIGDYYFRL